jgi:ParB-like chromosome segregation protein Spo0J
MKRNRRFRSQPSPEFHTKDLRPRPAAAASDGIEDVNVGKLKPYPRNARVHSAKQTRQIAKSIERFGFTAPILIDEEDNILAGHGRVAAAKLLNLRVVPCRRIKNLTDAEKRAYVLADNKLTLNATWDEEILAGELQGLLAENFDISLTGFSLPEIDAAIDGLAPEEPGAPEDDALR